MKLSRLTIKNFKGIVSETIDFEQNTTIERNNGGGKTTIAHAFFWLFDGKDADNSTARIKPEADGEEIHNLITEVEGVFDFGVLRREQKEVWRKQKGEAMPRYTGNEVTLFIDNVETKQAEWSAFLLALFPIKTVPQPWRLFSHPSYFLGSFLKVSEKNAFLMSMSNIPSDSDIAKAIDSDLLSFNLSNIAQEKQRLSNEIKREKEASDLLPGQITAVNGDIHRLKQIDITVGKKLESDLKEVELSISDIDKKASASINTEAVKLAKELQLRLTEAQAKVNTLTRKIQSEISTEILSEQKKATDSKRALQTLKDQLSEAAKELSKARIKHNELNTKRTGLLSLFDAESKKKYDSTLQFNQCQTCGQELPHSMIELQKSAFESAKKMAIEKIRIEGTQVKTAIEEAEKQIKVLSETEKSLQSKVESFVLHVAKTDEQIRIDISTPYTEESLRLNSDLAAVELEIELSQTDTTAPDTSFDAEKTELNQKRDAIKKALNELEFNANALAQKQKDLSALEAKLLQCNESIAEKELKKMLLDSFQKAKNEYISNSVNGLFNSLKFVFVQEFYNGNDKEICECLVNGVNYSTANTALQINSGIEFINAISKPFNIHMPIWVDCAESVQSVTSTESQIILLKVKQTL